ncbi:MAG: response regulator [Geminicoccaceae bacterium]
MSPFSHDNPVAGSILYIAHPAEAVPPTPTVLIIDHDAAVRDALSISLRTGGFGVLSFESAGHFLSARPLVRKGCLLVEFDLEDMTGTDLIAHLVVEQVALPAVVMSARLRSPILREPLPSGIVTILQNPFGRDELLRSVRLAIGT